MVMLSPDLMELFVHPTRLKRLGLVSSPLPFLRCSGVVLGFPENLDVRIDEIKSSHHAIYSNRLARIVVRLAVVRERHGRKRQKP